MYTRHFIKMLLWLAFMAIIGVGGLVLANYYSKDSIETSASTSAASK